MAPSTSSIQWSQLDVNTIKRIEDVKSAFVALSSEEEAITEELEHILDKHSGLDVKLRAISAQMPQLGDIRSEAQQLSNGIAHTSVLAERVSAKVRQLDLAKSRVAECQQRVHDLIDLKRCSEGVTTALQEEDYEQAAAHIHRFLAMDEGVLRLTSRELESGGHNRANQSSNLDSSLATLHQAENKVRGIVMRRFDEAVSSEDLASIERFFKIFPLINMQDEGLRKFALYLRGKLIATCKENLKTALDTPLTDKRAQVIFADTLTLLFEGIARIIEIHQPLIETYYGPGKIFTVISLLQEECDAQAAKIFKEFNRRRGISDKVRKIQDSALIKKDDSSKVQARDLDAILGEMTLLQNRVDMYYRFVRKRCVADLEVSNVESNDNDRRVTVDKMLLNTQLNRVSQDSLGEYILLEHYFMAENIAKAIELDTMEADQLTTSILDDVFFIIKKCIKRAINSNNGECICAVINNACALLETDFCQVFQNQIKSGFPSTYLDQAYTVIQSSLQQGKLGGASDTEKQKQLFLAYLNNAESASRYIGKLKTSIESDLAGMMGSASINPKLVQKIKTSVEGILTVSEKLKGILDSGMSALRSAVVKPRLKPWIDAFLSVSHNINEDQYSDYEANDPFVQNLIINVDGLLATFKSGLTEANYEGFINLVAGEATIQLEKVVLKSTFSRLGGLQFDKEVRALSSYLTSVATWTIRDRFSRLMQIANILNLETLQEVNDYCGNYGALSAKLIPAEVRQVLTLRVDFKQEDVKRVKFSM